MKKDNVLYGIIGLLFGLILGFYFTNKLNTSQMRAQALPAASTTGANPNNAAGEQLPADHPAVDGKNPTTKSGAALPQVQEALDAAKNQPNNFEVQMNAGGLYYQIQNFDEAVKFYTQANKIKPDAADVWVKLGDVYFDAGNEKSQKNQAGNAEFEKAQSWYEKYLAKNPDNTNVRTDLGLTFFLRDPPDLDRAIKEYQTSLSKNPNHELTLQNLAVAQRKKGDTNGFQETLERIRKVNPNNRLLTGDTTNNPAN